MSQTFKEFLKLLPHYQNLKHQMLEILSDEDLAHTIPGSPSLGALCKEMGEIQQSYIDSFKSFKLNFSYRNPDATLTTSTAALAAWYADLDKEMQAILESFSDGDLETRRVGRGNWMVPIELNLDIYLQAVLIFCGKAWVHLHALGKELHEQWVDWIG